MKRGAIEHPKMLMLAALLGVDKLVAVGIMESLWHFAAKYAPQGDIGKYTDEMIAAGISWTDGAERLINALIECQWLDKSGQVRLYVHDWHQHSDDYADKYLSYNGLTYSNGCKPRRKPPKNSTRGGLGRTSREKSYVSVSVSESESHSSAGAEKEGDAVHRFLVEHESMRSLSYEADLQARRNAGVRIDDPRLMKFAKMARARAIELQNIEFPGAFWRREIEKYKDAEPEKTKVPMGGECSV